MSRTPSAAVTHGGGLHLEKSSINMSVDVTNLIVQCTSLTGCRLLGTANQALPNEVAEIVDVVDDRRRGRHHHLHGPGARRRSRGARAQHPVPDGRVFAGAWSWA